VDLAAQLASPDARARVMELLVAVVYSEAHRSVVHRSAHLPGWRFACGAAVYLGPPSCTIDGDHDRCAPGPASLALADGAPGAGCDQADLQREWLGWSAPEQGVYEEVRGLALEVAPPAVRRAVEVRLVAMRFAVNRVHLYRAWLADVERGGRR
jgi:hypothetical protein